MQRKAPTILIYLSAAAAASSFWVSHALRGGRSAAWFNWLIFFAVPLLFLFAYARSFFASSAAEGKRLRSVALFHGVAAATATTLFPILVLPFGTNPMRDVDSLAFLLIPLIVLPIFLIAALSLLFRGRSSLAVIASFLFWPYWFLLALVTLDRFFQETVFHTVFCFLCFVAPVLFAVAAGAVPYRPALAHATAFAGLVAIPWIYWTTLRGYELTNDWIMFNVPDAELRMYDALAIAELTILSVALVVLAISTAALRLLPARWQLRNLPLRERTWLAVAATLLFLAVWFGQSVMPYRIPGAVDYADWPVLQILHVEKHGLQFHEKCINIWKRYGFRVSVAENHRRLFQYRFLQERSEGDLPQPLMQRVQAMVKSPDYAKKQGEAVAPVRSWNAGNWYFRVEGSAILTYTSEKATAPPREIVDLFRDLEATPRSSSRQSDLKDICLGFCYDPPAGLGFLYSNHRCFNDGHGVVCR